MRISQVVLALAGTLMCTGCSEMISLHPFVADSEAIQDARLPGVWVDGDDPMYIVRPDGNGYTIGQSDKSSPAVYKLKAKMLKVGEARILDLTPADEDGFQIGHPSGRSPADHVAARRRDAIPADLRRRRPRLRQNYRAQ